MSIASASLLAAISGLVTGWLSALLKPRGEAGALVAAHAVIGSLLATVAFGLFMIPGYVVGLMLFSGPPSPTIGLLCTLFADLAWVALAAGQRLLGGGGDGP
jgi:hypothetical protein